MNEGQHQSAVDTQTKSFYLGFLWELFV